MICKFNRWVEGSETEVATKYTLIMCQGQIRVLNRLTQVEPKAKTQTL